VEPTLEDRGSGCGAIPVCAALLAIVLLVR
jgi:hypothetical protein